jgi:hypothetical protein
VKCVSDIFKTTADQTPVPAEDEVAQPISIRQLDRLETTHQSSFNGG